MIISGPVTEAVILAAGQGTRMRPLTYRRPKPLIPILNKPFLQHQHELLEASGVNKVILIIGHMKEVIEDWLESLPTGLEVETRVQVEARGTGDAINTARGSVEGDFVVMNGDILLDTTSFYIAFYDPEKDEVSFPLVHDPTEEEIAPRRAGDGLAEYIIRNRTSVLIRENLFERQGFRVALGYFVRPKRLEVVGRYAEIRRLRDPNVEAALNTGLGLARIRDSEGEPQEAVERQIRELTFGVNYYISGDHQHKVFCDFSRLSREFAGLVNNGQLSGG